MMMMCMLCSITHARPPTEAATVEMRGRERLEGGRMSAVGNITKQGVFVYKDVPGGITKLHDIMSWFIKKIKLSILVT